MTFICVLCDDQVHNEYIILHCKKQHDLILTFENMKQYLLYLRSDRMIEEVDDSWEHLFVVGDSR